MTITIERFKLQTKYREVWSYNYTLSTDPMLCQYGPGLKSLLSMLKRKFPQATVIKTWEN